MGLYINKNQNSNVYKNTCLPDEPNQDFLKRNTYTELLNENKETYAALQQALTEIKKQSREQEFVQAKNWNDVTLSLHELKSRNLQQEEFDTEILQMLKTLNERMEKYENTNHHLTSQINEQLEMQKQLSAKYSTQEDFQTGVLNRLDQQEALTEKIYRQLNHIRSILFERTNYLGEKIEEGYRITSSYVHKIMTGSDQPLTFYLLNKKEEKQK